MQPRRTSHQRVRGRFGAARLQPVSRTTWTLPVAKLPPECSRSIGEVLGATGAEPEQLAVVCKSKRIHPDCALGEAARAWIGNLLPGLAQPLDRTHCTRHTTSRWTERGHAPKSQRLCRFRHPGLLVALCDAPRFPTLFASVL